MQAARGAAVGRPSGEDRPADGAGLAARRRHPAAVAVVAAVVLAADVVSKVLVVDRLSDRPPVHVLDDVLRLTLTRNPGAAFGIGAGATILFTAVAVAVAVVLARTARRLASRGWAVSFGLLLGGALGNLVDRICRAPGPFRGYVVDWIQLPHWPVFNIADSAIVVGGILAVLLSAYGIEVDGSRRHTGNGG